MNYEIGAQVLYGVHGICTIQGIESMRFGKTRAKYYVLQPVGQPDARYYVPVDNESAVTKMRPLMTREALLELLHSPQVRSTEWTAEENQRKLQYKELLSSGDRARLLGMIYCLNEHKKQLQQAGRKFHQSDEYFLADAQKLLNAEFAHVFDLEPGQVNAFVTHELGLD